MSNFFIFRSASVVRAARSAGPGRPSAGEPLRNDLPRDPEPILQPAALLRRRIAALGEALPVVVDLGLVGALATNETASSNAEAVRR